MAQHRVAPFFFMANNKKELRLNPPMRESMSYSRQYGYGFDRGREMYNKIRILLDGHIGRPFSEFYWKIKPYLKFKSKPMTYILKHYFSVEDDYSIVEGLIVYTPDTKKEVLPYNCLVKDSIYYSITEESKMGCLLRLSQNYGNKVYNIEQATKYGYGNSITYKDFITIFGIEQRKTYKYRYTAKITHLEAMYYLYPERYNYVGYGGSIIDPEKCISFDSKKSLLKYVKRRNYEKEDDLRKKERKDIKDKQLKAQSLIGNAMIDFKLRKEKVKQQQLEQKQKEEALSAEIRNRHGFDETSFMAYRVPVKDKK
jgi:hypothetical protein